MGGADPRRENHAVRLTLPALTPARNTAKGRKLGQNWVETGSRLGRGSAIKRAGPCYHPIRVTNATGE
jgi:hypothetical protein